VTCTSAFAAIRNWAGGMSQGSGGTGGTGPTIIFDDPTPAQDSVVSGNSVYGGGTLVIRALANASSGSITRIEMVVDGQSGPVFLRDGNTSFSTEAFQNFTGGNPSESLSFNWNTTQVNSSGNPAVQDGYRTVMITAFDHAGQQAAKQRRFLVDNYPPDAPTGPAQTITAAGYSLADAMTWTQALDGTEPAAKYEAQLVKDTAGAATLAGWTAVGTYVPTPAAGTSVSTAIDPLSRYLLRVRAGSPRATSGGTQSWSAWTETASAKISPPFLQGTYRITETKSKGKSTFGFTSTFSIPAIPAWANSGSADYDLLRAQGNGAFALVADVTGSAGGAYTDIAPSQGPLGNNVSPVPYTYQLRVTLTPKGYKASGAETVLSNTAQTGVAATTGANFTPGW